MGRVNEGTSSQTPNPKAGLMGLNHSQTTSLSQKQGWKCVCDGLSLEAQGEEDEEKKELSPHVPPGLMGVPMQDRGHGMQLSGCMERRVLLFSPALKKSIKPTLP